MPWKVVSAATPPSSACLPCQNRCCLRFDWNRVARCEEKAAFVQIFQNLWDFCADFDFVQSFCRFSGICEDFLKFSWISYTFLKMHSFRLGNLQTQGNLLGKYRVSLIMLVVPKLSCFSIFKSSVTRGGDKSPHVVILIKSGDLQSGGDFRKKWWFFQFSNQKPVFLFKHAYIPQIHHLGGIKLGFLTDEDVHPWR